ncbi:MAG: hypothetical protein V1763_02440 [Parcubacteria group bacterium]
MFEQLFGSKTRVKLMRIFLDNPEKKFFVRELTRLSESLINSVRRELDKLVEMKFIKVQETKEKTEEGGLNAKRFYYLNDKNLFQTDLLNLFSKGKILIEKKFLGQLRRLGDIKYLALGGFFVDDANAKTDVLIVGNLDQKKAGELLQRFEKQVSRPINYTIMDEEEYKLRENIADRFLEEIISNDKNIVVIDKRRC